MMFIKKSPNSHGWVNPRDVEDLWRDHFDYFYREEEDFCFPVTIHPDVGGHPHVILLLERCVGSISYRYIMAGFPLEGILRELTCSPLQINRIHQQQTGRRVGQDGRHL